LQHNGGTRHENRLDPRLYEQILDQLLLQFKKSIDSLITWCIFNRLDINWDKIELMFFTQKREIDFPKTVMIQNKTINVIDQFKLPGIIIDNDLTFLPQVASLRIKINQRLFSIKKIFFLENSVKLLIRFSSNIRNLNVQIQFILKLIIVRTYTTCVLNANIEKYMHNKK
jgi:hypothetical protein